MDKQLAFSTLGCPDWTFEHTVTQAAQMGFTAVEVRGFGAEMRTERLPCFLPENRAATRALLERCGIKLCVAGTSVRFHDERLLPSALDEGRRAVDTCAEMAIPCIRVFGDELPAGEGRAQTIGRVAEGLAELCDYAAGRGAVKVLLEIHGDFNTVDAVAPVLERLSAHPAFGVIWDVEHSFRAYGEDFTGFYELIRPWIRHIHIKDCVMHNGEAVVRLPGYGDVNIPQILGRLKRDGYGGYYSFEWEKRWHPEIAEPEEAFPEYARRMREWLKDA